MSRRSRSPSSPEDVLVAMGREPTRFVYVGRAVLPARHSVVSVVPHPKVPKGATPFGLPTFRTLIDTGADAVSAMRFVRRHPRAEAEDERLIFPGATWKSQTGYLWVLVCIVRDGKRTLELEDYFDLFFSTDSLRHGDKIVVCVTSI